MEITTETFADKPVDYRTVILVRYHDQCQVFYLLIIGAAVLSLSIFGWTFFHILLQLYCEQ